MVAWQVAASSRASGAWLASVAHQAGRARQEKSKRAMLKMAQHHFFLLRKYSQKERLRKRKAKESKRNQSLGEARCRRAWCPEARALKEEVMSATHGESGVRLEK